MTKEEFKEYTEIEEDPKLHTCVHCGEVDCICPIDDSPQEAPPLYIDASDDSYYFDDYFDLTNYDFA